MSKDLSAYDGFSATDIKNKADIPMQNNITVNGSTIQCTDILLTDVKNAIGTSSTTVDSLCTDSSVNKWSNFGPTEWYVSNQSLYNRVKTPYSLGNFAGYNKDAVEPTIITKTVNAKIIEYPTTFDVTAVVRLGEYDFSRLNQNLTRLWLKVYDGLTPVGENYVDITNNADNTYYIHATVQSPYDRSYHLTGKLYFASFVGEVIAWFPNSFSWDIEVEFLTEPSMSVGVDYTTFPQFGTMMTTEISGNPSSVNVNTNVIYVRKDLKLIPTFSDCGGNGNFPRFNNSPLVYNADIVLTKHAGGSTTFTNVISGNQTCVTYANTGDNANPPYQRIWFDYTVPAGYDIEYGDIISIYIKRMNSTFQYGYCSGGTPVYVP